MSRKNVLHQYNLFDGQTVDMANSLISNISNVEQFDKASIHISWTAGPVGEFSLQARNGGTPVANTALPKAKIDDTWYDLDFGELLTISGTDSEILLQLLELPFTDIRLIYTPTSGSATDLQALLTEKVQGA